ncbi:MAG: hypothetical protein ACTSVU_08955 [Promethearchaeota archaeon]
MQQNASGGRSILVDLSHNNIVSPDDPDFNQFFQLINNYQYQIQYIHPNEHISEEILSKYQIFLIGDPQNSQISDEEINLILNYVKNGGSLLVFTHYGGDFLQNTNLNSLISKFGIQSENNLIRTNQEFSYSSTPIHFLSPHIDFIQHVSRIRMPGACALKISDSAEILCQANRTAEIQYFDEKNKIPLQNEESLISGAFANFGIGKVVVLGSPDFLISETHLGINTFDNREFILQVLSWLYPNLISQDPINSISSLSPINSKQLAIFSSQIQKLTKEIGEIHHSMENFEFRIRNLEYTLMKKSQESSITSKSSSYPYSSAQISENDVNPYNLSENEQLSPIESEIKAPLPEIISKALDTNRKQKIDLKKKRIKMD